MSRKDLEEVLDAVKEILKLGEASSCDCDCHKEEEKENNHDENENENEKEDISHGCEFLKSLQADYTSFLDWVFGKAGENESMEACKLWNRLHPNLPPPRILLSHVALNSSMSSICLVLDAYPLYLEEKKKSKS